MADEADRAAARQAELTADALRRWRRRQGPAWSVQASAVSCVGCGAPLPEARRRAVPGVRRCVGCATEQERAGR